MNGLTAESDCSLSNFACSTEEVGTNRQHDLTNRIADEQIEQPAAEEHFMLNISIFRAYQRNRMMF
jgi:hypothetical protein